MSQPEENPLEQDTIVIRQVQDTKQDIGVAKHGNEIQANDS